MKRLTIIGTCVLLSFMTAVSCLKDNPNSNGNVKTDDARFLLANLAFTDDNGNITGYMTGFGLNEGNPGEVSIPCESFSRAKDMFFSWIPEEAFVRQSEEEVRWDMTDSLGISQGTAILRAGGAKGAVAHLELPDRFPSVTSVQFLPQSAFPGNAELDFDDALDDFYFLNHVNIYPEMAHEHGGGSMLVIREYDQETNTSGILISTPDKELDFWYYANNEQTIKKRSRSLAELQVVGKAYRKYWKAIDEALTNGYRCVNGDHWYICYEKKYDSDNASRTYMIYNYRSNETKELMPFFSPTFYETYVYFFTMEKKDGVYRLVFK